MGLVHAVPANALRVNFSSKGDSNLLLFSFDSNTLPDFSVRRIGSKELAITFPADIWDTETKPGKKDLPGKLVQSISTAKNVVQVKTRTNAFGFIRIPSPGKMEFVLQLYRDPIGARWKPPVAKSAVAPPPNPAPNPVSKPALEPAPQPVVQSVPEQVAPKPVGQPVPVAQPVQQPPAEGGADLPPEIGRAHV